METDLSKILETAKGLRKNKSTFITLDDGESFQGRYVGVKEESNQYGACYSFMFNINGTEKKLQKAIDNTTFLSVLVEAGVKEGDILNITRRGNKSKTTYSIKKVEQYDTEIKEEPPKGIKEIFN